MASPAIMNPAVVEGMRAPITGAPGAAPGAAVATSTANASLYVGDLHPDVNEVR